MASQFSLKLDRAFEPNARIDLSNALRSAMRVTRVVLFVPWKAAQFTRNAWMCATREPFAGAFARLERTLNGGEKKITAKKDSIKCYIFLVLPENYN